MFLGKFIEDNIYKIDVSLRKKKIMNIFLIKINYS